MGTIDATTMATKCEEAGVTVELKLYEGTAHGFQMNLCSAFKEKSKDSFERINQFLERHWHMSAPDSQAIVEPDESSVTALEQTAQNPGPELLVTSAAEEAPQENASPAEEITEEKSQDDEKASPEHGLDSS